MGPPRFPFRDQTMKKTLRDLRLPLGGIAIALATFVATPIVHAEDAAAYSETLVAKARQKGLETSTKWLRLGHWRKSGSSYESEADGPGFFLTPNGKTDPAAELDATIRGFYARKSPKNDHVLCRFPARFAWLSKELSFDLGKLPAVECPKFVEYWEKIKVKSLTLVFSSYYLNNPSSAFGHTFLRLNQERGAGEESRALLDLGVNYAANPDDANALVYAIKGLTGQYPGVWSLIPYYYKVREYNDFESRDIWEYELSLPPDEVETVAAHLWELGQTYFDYWYMSENCSYHILGALEVANPNYHFVDRLHYPVVPAETVKVLYTVPGLVKAVHYRPSMRSTFRRRIEDLGSLELDVVEALATNPDAPLGGLSNDRLVKVFDAALDLVDLRYAKEILDDKDSLGAKLKQRLMERRAELGLTSEDLTFELPSGELPHLSHGAARFGYSFGATNHRQEFIGLDYRLSLHDLADSTIGYPEFAQLEFLHGRFAYWMQDRKIRLEEGSLLKILSLNPWSRFDQKPSWKVAVGVTRNHDSGCPDCTFGSMELGSGFAFGQRVTFFTTLDARLLALRFTGDEGPKVRFSLGPSSGLRIRFSDRVISVTSGNLGWLPFNHPKVTWAAESTFRIQYTQNASLTLEGRVNPLGSSAMIGTYIYY